MMGVYKAPVPKKRRMKTDDEDSDEDFADIKRRQTGKSVVKVPKAQPKKPQAPTKKAPKAVGGDSEDHISSRPMKTAKDPLTKKATTTTEAKASKTASDSEDDDVIRTPQGRLVKVTKGPSTKKSTTIRAPAPAPAREPLASKNVAPPNRRAPLSEDSIPTDEADYTGYRPEIYRGGKLEDHGRWVSEGRSVDFQARQAQQANPSYRKTTRPIPEYMRPDRVAARERVLKAKEMEK